ncbi:MAG: redox-regulated ATPase YchF [Planctomycetes bacterium]|nr:redox-regulated ATPase YchF [Planctomycetota bacterium]
MRIALLGWAGSGKTTVFNAVADSRVPSTPGVLQTEEHVQVVKVQDPRMVRLRDLFKPKKFTLAGLELHDPPGLPAGTEPGDAEKRTRLLGALRESDGYVLVVRGFSTDSYAYPRPAPDPAADVARLVEELMVSDLNLLQGRAERLRENIKKRAKSLEQDQRELAVIERMLPRLEAGKGLQDLEVSVEDERKIRGFQLFSRKPYVLLVNGPAGVPAGLGDGLAFPMPTRIALDGMLAAELAAMDPADRPAFMAEFGIDEPASERVVHAVYQAAGLRSFFTVGEDEVRAWTIRVGDDAVTAASKIHSDLAKGFVRAEVTPYDAIVSAGGLKESKAAMRLEGKDYVVGDGDIVHIRSSV